MTAPLLLTTEKRLASPLPILVVDKQGILSQGMALFLKDTFTVALVSHLIPPNSPRIVHIPFPRSIPHIPDEVYSAIILFYQGEEALRDGMPSFIKKAKQNNAKLLLVTDREHAAEAFLHHALTEYDYAYLLVLGDVFGSPRDEGSILTRLLSEAHHRQKLLVRGNGLAESYPVLYADIVKATTRVLFAEHSPRVVFLFPRHAVAEVSLARLIQKQYPDAVLDFLPEAEEAAAVPLKLHGEYGLEDPYPLDEKIRQMDVRTLENDKPVSKRKLHHTKRLRGIRPFLITLAIILVVFPLSTVFFFLFGLLSLSVTAKALEEGRLSLLRSRAETALVSFELAETTSRPLSEGLSVFGLRQQASRYQDMLEVGETASDALVNLAAAAIAYQGVSGGKALNPTDQLVSLTGELERALLDLSVLRTNPSLPTSLAGKLRSYQTTLSQGSSLIGSLPYLVGLPQKQTYLVLFQNNMELRPGGGFIGSYGLLTMRNGRLASFTIHDVYDADGQLTGHVEPPFGLRRYMGVAHWFLRDSNYDIEFSQNAAQAASFLKLETGEEVDGVIAVDVSFLRLLLQSTGPVYLPNYNETVSAKNFYLLTQTHAEKDFFPGSTQKKDFLEEVAQAMIRSFKDNKTLPYGVLLETVSQGIAQKHVMLASSDEALMLALEKNGLAPTIKALPQERSADLPDFLSIMEANVGTNKTNYYLKRSITQSEVLAADGMLASTVNVQYTNTATAGSQFGGDYKTYVRFVLPGNATLSGITINGDEQQLVPAVTSERVYTSDRFVPPEGLEVDRTTEDGRTLYGFYLVVPAGKTMLVSVTYTVPPVKPLGESITYTLRVFKQPGTDYDPYQLNLQYPASYTLIHAPQNTSHTGQRVTFSGELATDVLLSLQFAKQ